jgi:hypothetical protein
MTRGLLLSALIAVASIARGTDITPPLPQVGPPLILRLEGVLEPSRAATRGVGFTAASLGFRGADVGRQRWLAVTDARTVGGDHPLLGKDVLNAVAPFAPSFYVAGTPELVARVRDLPTGTPVRLEGLVSRGSRTYLLRLVEVRAPAGDGSSAGSPRTA